MQALYNQLTYFALFQSLFLLSVYVFSYHKRKTANVYLVVLVLAIIFGLTGRIIYISPWLGQEPKPLLLAEFAGLIFGSTIFLFSRSVLYDLKWKKSDLVHYLPAILYMFMILIVYVIPSYEVLEVRNQSGELKRSISMFHATSLLVNLSYWSASVLMIIQNRRRLKNELSFLPKSKFLIRIHWFSGICLFTWVSLFIISLVGNESLERDFRNVIWLALAFLVLFIAFYTMVYPQIFLRESLGKVLKYKQSRLSSKDLNDQKDRLDALMEEKKPFLNNRLMKVELAELMGLSSPDLARVLNEGIGMNFFEYVNYYRVKAFIELAKTEKATHMTLFGIAQEVGFNSKSTFNSAFKKLTGTTPTSYFRNLPE